MKPHIHVILFSIGALLGAASPANAQPDASGQPYRIVRTARVGGPGGWDYVLADAEARRLYVPRGDRITVFDLDTLALVSTIPGANSVHGVAIDPASHHAFSSSRPLLMWDSRTLAAVKTIAVQGSPDGILFEPATERIFVFSHRAPNVTVVDAVGGALVGTIDIGGAPEQAASDGRGRVYIDVEDKDEVAVVDVHALRVTARYGLGGKGGGPGALALDAQNHILFSYCHDPAVAVVLDADDGRILATLPIGKGVDSAEFNPATREAFSSQGDGTLTVIKEEGPARFMVEQTVATRAGARTSALDARTGHVFLVTADRKPAPPQAPGAAGSAAQPAPRWGRVPMVPGSFTILEVGK
jgi:DNA-binding beta-propeller fold protein YncE